MKRIIFAVCMAALMLALPACNQDKEVAQDFDRSARPQAITVYVYPNERAVTDAFYKQMAGKKVPHDGASRLGFANWVLNENRCEIHVAKIRTENDPRMETWGHELAHCIYGNFHN